MLNVFPRLGYLFLNCTFSEVGKNNPSDFVIIKLSDVIPSDKIATKQSRFSTYLLINLIVKSTKFVPCLDAFNISLVHMYFTTSQNHDPKM